MTNEEARDDNFHGRQTTKRVIIDIFHLGENVLKLEIVAKNIRTIWIAELFLLVNSS